MPAFNKPHNTTQIKDVPLLNKILPTSQQHKPIMPVGNSDQNAGVTGGAKFVTSALGNTVGGVTRTVGNVTGAATQGVGDTISSATGSAGRPVGDGIANLGQGLSGALNSVGKGAEDAGQWKRS
ncbi:hypothetical protein BDP81DRAFT_429363 [Colletotrichum phormii]|uniref:Uncharacterized protein n=1 Tax=Colletotrichum phormii TaxID=359342 RepID=A0AAJ0EGP5_9PEZI|nr:uncharacterized protein BDP81DRAFT_429363 [Colletotrichum phormii]KAK1636266.1 hypothetical protein BDP81DRAFT_429363 [Colletotrichum phormii]